MNRVSRFWNATGVFGYLLLTLLLALVVFVNLSLLGCNGGGGGGGCGSDTSSSTYINKSVDTSAYLTGAAPQDLDGKSVVSPGSTVNLSLKGTWGGTGNGILTWQPPQGVTNFQFHDHSPEPGGPPFVFKDISAAQASGGFKVSYTIPTGYPEGDIQDLLRVQAGQTQSAAVTRHTVDSNPPPGSSMRVDLKNEAAEDRSSLVTAEEAHPVWSITRYDDFDVPLNQQTCLDFVAQGKSANTFMAWRVPVADEIVNNQPYRIPVVHSLSNRPKIILQSGVLSLEMPLEVRLDATAWANTYLPQADGQLWLAMGVEPDVEIDCPEMDRENFSMLTQFSIDLSTLPGECENCVLPAFSCYKTDTPAPSLSFNIPGLLAGSARHLATGGFTCVGPADTQLVDQPGWHFTAFTTSLYLKPGDPIAIHYWIENQNTEPLPLTLAPASTLNGVDWVIHPGLAGNPWQPDPDQIVGSSIVVPAADTFQSGWFHLYINGTVPAATTPGQYQYSLQLSNPSAKPPDWLGSTVMVVSTDGSLPGIEDPAPGVGLSGVSIPATVIAGHDLTYHLIVQNTGSQPLTGLVLSAEVPVNTTYVSCGGGDSCQFTAGEITWNLAALGTGQDRVLELVVKAGPGLVPGHGISFSSYQVQTGQGVFAQGPEIITQVSGSTIYLPMLTR